MWLRGDCERGNGLVQMKKKAAATKRPKDENKARINTAIRSQVLPRLKPHVPALADTPDDTLYDSAMEDPDVLHAVLEAFAAHRAEFGDVTVGIGGAPVVDDDQPLVCGRTTREIIGMAVRSGARRFSRRVLDEKVTDATTATTDAGLLDALRGLIREFWEKDARSDAKAKSPAERFYQAIADHLGEPWQVPLFPYYVELPSALIAELGAGLTTLRSPEGIRELARIGRENLDEAKRIVGDELAREMLDTNPRSARGVASIGKAEFERLNSAFGEILRENRWEVFNDLDRLDVLREMDTKQVEALAKYLPIVGPDTLRNIKAKFKHLYQVEGFLDVGIAVLGKDLFVSTFGNPGNPRAVQKLTEKMSLARITSDNQEAEFNGILEDVLRAYATNPKAYTAY